MIKQKLLLAHGMYTSSESVGLQPFGPISVAHTILDMQLTKVKVSAARIGNSLLGRPSTENSYISKTVSAMDYRIGQCLEKITEVTFINKYA